MPQAADRIFIAIAVSRPGGGLDELPGAIRAAERMAAWATAQGYATRVVHDGTHAEVTVDLLREEIAAAIKATTDQTELKRLVVFFAGHGAALAVGDQYWILTHWRKRPTEAIKVSSLQRMLEYYGPRQVAIIGDACQEFSAKFIDVVGSPVLDMPDEEQRPYELDQFFAVDAGKQAFMIKAADGQDDFCLFTEVLLDALEGDAPAAAYEWIEAGRQALTSQSLALYLDGNVAQEAGKYGVRMIPRPRPGFYSDRVYFRLPPPSPTSPPAPAPATPLPPPMPSFPSAPAPAGSPFGGASGTTPGAAPPTSGSVRDEAGPFDAAAPVVARAVERVQLVVPTSSPVELAASTQALQQAREAQRHAFAEEVGRANVRDHFETGCGVCVSGIGVAKVEASHGEVSAVDGATGWFRIRLDEGQAARGWSDTLVTLANGQVCAVCVVQGFIAALHVRDDGSLSLFHRPIGASDYEGQMAIDLLARAHAGLLDRQEIIDTAAMLRYGKHRIITLGCIAAQFYDTIRDVDSLRAMASFYAQHQQPVPLDIVLYGGGRIADIDGRLFADIPAVPPRQPRTRQEQTQPFTVEATPGFDRYPVAGRVPWMRHAWGAVATARCDASAADWRRQALEVLTHLAPGAFTSVTARGREALAALSGVAARRHAGVHASPS